MRRSQLWVAALVIAFGCNITASLGGGEDASTGSIVDVQTTGGVAQPGSSSTSGAAGGTGGHGTTGSSSSDGSTASSGSGGDRTSTGFDEEALCRSPFDGSCVACIQESCCEALLECVDDPDCACLLGCLEFAPDFLSCVGIPACQGGFGTRQIAACAGLECTQPCGLPASPAEDPGFSRQR